tara:strand:+ start:53 stop:289 length:237 start_codon:yes stop_codon:yes gene_type:complete
LVLHQEDGTKTTKSYLKRMQEDGTTNGKAVGEEKEEVVDHLGDVERTHGDGTMLCLLVGVVQVHLQGKVKAWKTTKDA